MKKGILISAGIMIMAFFLCHWGLSGSMKEPPPYLNTALSFDERVEDLIKRMTLEEKVSQMVHPAAAVERLGIPEYNWWNEALHGVARAGRATVFPQAIGLAATWDTKLMFRIAEAISDEARAKHHEFIRRGKKGIYQGLTFWSPNINIFRDPRWGRGMETYGEDPFLTGKLAVQFVKGMQGDDPRYLKTVATPKHFAVHSGPEPDRHTFNAVVSERDLRETYLPSFRDCFVEAGAASVMCAYNRYLGDACCASSRLLKEILREEWGFRGYVVSDCGAINDIYRTHKIVGTSPEAAASGVKAGCDLNCGREYHNLSEAVSLGLITEEEIDSSLRRLFQARFKLGMFDPPEMVPYSRIPYEVNDCFLHRRLALEAARKSIVLLKNENGVLPLSKNLKSIAVIGPHADNVEVLLGNYNGFPLEPVTPLQGIKKKVCPGTEIIYAQGCDFAEGFPVFRIIPQDFIFTGDGEERVNGFKGEYYDNDRFEGDPVFTRIDKMINFDWWDGAPRAEWDDDDFSIRWTGRLVTPVSGTYYIGASAHGEMSLFVDGDLFIQHNSVHHPRLKFHKIRLEAGRDYNIRFEYANRHGDARGQLVWVRPDHDFKKEALEAADKADAVILFMGITPSLEGEEMKVDIPGFKGGDRTNLKLPEVQVNLIRSIHALGKPTILVLMNGSPLAVCWEDDHLPAIIEAWYPGQAGGEALADILFGDANPGGRLPLTFYRAVSDLPPFDDYNMENRTYRYFQGEPLYPFGYGLSYTSFRYGNLNLPSKVPAGNRVVVSVDMENIGKRSGEEVVQLYVRDVEASVPVPIRSLKGFQRIRLEPGEKKTVCFILLPRDLSLIDRNGVRVCEPGFFEVSAGGGQSAFSGKKETRATEVLTGRFEVTGSVFVIHKDSDVNR
ncbi:MAG: glycoside hydrolase family 3 C-terminal domain-containing protein [Candidatus Aminicenantes bacterium]|nr:glycoside hydrolase family 3 C-terminal domain-containing protein [Candidatus Aminicenantes bacterium]